jgi:hypothetical protein
MSDEPRHRGRPRLPPVSTDEISDVQAFWRLKAVRLDSYQSMKAVAFSVVWQQSGNSIDGVVASAYCGRRTAFNRLKCCRLAGFEPDYVKYEIRDADAWLALEREWIRGMEDSYERQMENAGVVGRLFMRLAGTADPYRDPLEVD